MSKIDNVAIFYRPSKDKPCTTCVFLDGLICTLWDAETREGMGCAYWLEKSEKPTKGG